MTLSSERNHSVVLLLFLLHLLEALFCQGDVALGVFHCRLALLGADAGADFSWHADDERIWRDFCAAWDDGASCDDAAAADLCAIHDDGAHADEDVVLDGAAVNDGAMADGDAAADGKRPAFVDVEHGAVLHICARADGDAVFVTAHDGNRARSEWGHSKIRRYYDPGKSQRNA